MIFSKKNIKMRVPLINRSIVNDYFGLEILELFFSDSVCQHMKFRLFVGSRSADVMRMVFIAIHVYLIYLFYSITNRI